MEEYQSIQMSFALKGIKVKDVMVKDIVTVSPNDSLEDFEKLLLERYKGYPVVSDGKVLTCDPK